jgi:hypothetical protein
VANGADFQEQVKQLGKLIAQFDGMPEGSQKNACKELVQLLMDVHGTGLERMMEVVFESGPTGSAIIDKLGQDSITGSLLLLYSLHPDDLETRVLKAVERLRSRLRKLSCSAELARISEGSVQVRVTRSGHSCGSSTKDIRAIVEEGIYELAPDVTLIEVLGLEEPSSGGFVPLESLLDNNLAVAGPAGHALRTEGAD